MANLTTVHLLFSAVLLCYLLPQVSALPTVGFKLASSSESETSGLITISLERTVQTNISTTVTVELSGSANATKDSDYVVSGSLTVTFAVNDTTDKNISLFIINDKKVEERFPETINLTIKEKTDVYNRKPDFESHIVSIADDDVSISCQNTNVNETSRSAVIEITRSGSSQALSPTHSIRCFTTDDSAANSKDYITVNSAISFTSTLVSSKQMSIPIINNTKVPEGENTFNVTCYTNDDRVQIQSSCRDAVVTIVNDDSYVFLCNNGPAGSVMENAGTYFVDICRVGALSFSRSVKLCRTAESNLPTKSIIAGCQDLTFAANTDKITATINITDDTVGETENQTFTINLESADISVTIHNDTTPYNVTLQDDDNTFYLTDVSEMTMTEGAGSKDVNVTINRIGHISVAASVSLGLIFTAATAESADCTGTSPRVIQFTANETSRTITACTVVDDRLVEDDETFNVTISGVSPSNVRDGKSERIIKLISDDVNVTCQGASLKEADGNATVILNRTGATALTANSIFCSTANGTAFSPYDYQPISVTVSFAQNDLNKVFDVFHKDNRVVEADESYTVNCNTSDPKVVVDPSCDRIQINIINDDTYVYFCPGYSTSIEENVGSYTVRLCRVGVFEDTHTVRLCWTSDSVSLPHDYPAVQAGCNHTVFTANETVKELGIPVTNDTWGEQEYKTFNITMNTTDPHVTFNGTTSYVVTIHDDDSTFCFTRTSATVYERQDKFINFTIKRTGAIIMSNASVIINTLPQTAIDPEDYTEEFLNHRMTFFTEEMEKNISVKIVNDRIVEDDETFQLSLTGVDGSTVFPECNTSTVTIVSDDVNVTCQGASLKEADINATVRLNRTGATALTANNISCSTANDTAFSPIDYQSQTSTTVSFALNELTKNLEAVLKNDRVVETNENFTITCNTSDPRVVVDPSCIGIQINIINDDTYVYFCPGYSTSIEESVGSYTARLCRVGVLEATHTVRLCWTSDSVSLPHDYPAVQAQCDDKVFTAYETVKEHVIPVTNDTWGEQEYKTFNISMNTTDPHVTFNDTTSYVVTIHDDDNTFCFTRTSPKVYEEYDKFVNLTIKRTGEITMSSASVVINTSPQTAITPEDYTEPILDHRVDFIVGEVAKNISVNIVNDKLVEDDQTFQLSLTGVGDSTVFPDCQTSTVTIVSNDVNIFCRDRRGFQAIKENKGPVLMEFTREGSLQYNHTIKIRTIDGTAQSGKDYTAIDKTLTFAPHQTSMIETIVLVNDNVVEPDETFRLSVASSDDRVYTICPGTHFTIVNDDTFIRCADQSVEVNEGNKTVYFTLKREGVLSKESPIWFSTKDGTAVDKSDYKPQNKVNRTFLPGQVYMTVSVDLVDDDYKEDKENFSVIIGSHVPTTLTSGDKCTVIIIKDDDPDRMTEQQAQELLVRRRNFLIILGVAGAFMVLVVILFICCVCYILRRAKNVDAAKG